MAQRNVKWYNGTAYTQMMQRCMKWLNVMQNGTAYIQSVALREMAQRNVEWYSVNTNGVALREMAQRNGEWYSVHTKFSVSLYGSA